MANELKHFKKENLMGIKPLFIIVQVVSTVIVAVEMYCVLAILAAILF